MIATTGIWLAVILAAAIALLSVRSLLGQQRARRTRELMDDALKHLLNNEHRGRRATLQSLAGVLRRSDRHLLALVGRLEREGLVQTHGQDLHLTPNGERRALHVVRAHRLWERYLADEARVPLPQLHREADRHEHRLTADDVERLDASLGHPRSDPHGDPIPAHDGPLPPAQGVALTEWTADEPGCVVHLEDEPPIVYAQLLAEGLRLGQILRVLDVTPERVLVTDGDMEFRLAPAVAANVFVAPIMARAELPPGTLPLSELADTTPAEVVALDESCQGFTRRRLLDLGFTPGARVTSEMRTFAGDPRAYRIRGVLIAVRREQAQQILVRPIQSSSAVAPAGTAAHPEHVRASGAA